MREFTKQIITALKEDDWVIRTRHIKHVKSFLILNLDEMQPEDVPFKFTWWERRIVGHYVRRLQDRMLVATLIAGRVNPRKPGGYSYENTFL